MALNWPVRCKGRRIMKHDEPDESVPDVTPGVAADEVGHPGNLGEPIRLKGVKLHGVAAESARAESKFKVWTRLALTSDESIFHRIAANLGALMPVTPKRRAIR
jgi:hypothetical protein